MKTFIYTQEMHDIYADGDVTVGRTYLLDEDNHFNDDVGHNVYLNAGQRVFMVSKESAPDRMEQFIARADTDLEDAISGVASAREVLRCKEEQLDKMMKVRDVIELYGLREKA